jgi:hypothetical protein
VRPSTRAKLLAGFSLAAVLAGMILVLPRLGRWFGTLETGFESRDIGHFTVYASNEETALLTGDEAERFCAGMIAAYGAARGFGWPPGKIRIVLCDDHDQLSRHGLLKLGQPLENNGGYFSAEERAVNFVGASPKALRHELTHMLLTLSWTGADLSPWFNEGMAQWHEAGVAGAMPFGTEAKVLKRLEEGQGVPLRALLSTPQSAFASEANEVYYAESVAFFGYLATRRKGALERVIALERAPGRPSPEETAEAVGAPLDEIEREWREFLTQAAR